MTPQELKELALKSTQAEADKIEAELVAAAKRGFLSHDFKGLSDGVIVHLKSKGFKVTADIFTSAIPFLDNAEKKYTVSFE